ncbi:hypothetical protein chiPu_0028166 [Chiloscyllium punctatum]|uniref:Uncharacterized protein n=1 Tax=Chiloscyllium punctatum TaxID=137246 RepID=A0A401TNJ1_CHIPU|nr:hypothetical protein [Chiloscyllium punctatum]
MTLPPPRSTPHREVRAGAKCHPPSPLLLVSPDPPSVERLCSVAGKDGDSGFRTQTPTESPGSMGSTQQPPWDFRKLISAIAITGFPRDARGERARRKGGGGVYTYRVSGPSLRPQDAPRNVPEALPNQKRREGGLSGGYDQSGSFYTRQDER